MLEPVGRAAVEDRGRRARRRRGRRRRSSRRGGSRRARARRRTANCRRPSADRARSAALRCRRDAGRRRARRARRRRRTDWSAPAWRAAGAAVRRARAWACCVRATDSRGPRSSRTARRATRSCGDPLGDDRLLRMRRGHLRQRGGAAVGVGREDCGQPLQRQPRHLGDVEAGEFHGERFAAQALAVAERAVAADHVLRDALLHQRALGVGEGVQHVALGAGEGALIAGLLLALERARGPRRA